jgi:hypothetical protein
MLRHTLKVWILVLAAFLGWGPVQAANGNNNPTRTERVEPPLPPEIQQMVNRVEEIRKMDYTALTKQERKNLKQELRAIKQEMKAIQGIYLSVGAIIIIILLLILIL